MTLSSLHVVLLSRLGRNEGGRETWMYNFLPRLVLQDRNLLVKVFGIREEAGTSVAEEFHSILDSDAAHRFLSDHFQVCRICRSIASSSAGLESMAIFNRLAASSIRSIALSGSCRSDMYLCDKVAAAIAAPSCIRTP